MKEQYLVLSEVTEKKFPCGLDLNAHQAELLHAAMGCVTESGELMDQLKRHLIYDAPLDSVNVAEEIGDIMWYCAIVARRLGLSFEEIQNKNIEKLQKRFGDKFTAHAALNRDLAGEREVLEK